MRFSVEGSNVASTRSSGRGGSGAQIKMDKFEGIKKRIFVEDKGRGRNRTLRTQAEAATEFCYKCVPQSTAVLERLQEAPEEAVKESR